MSLAILYEPYSSAVLRFRFKSFVLRFPPDNLFNCGVVFKAPESSREHRTKLVEDGCDTEIQSKMISKKSFIFKIYIELYIYM